MSALFADLEKAKLQRFDITRDQESVFDVDSLKGICQYNGRLPADANDTDGRPLVSFREIKSHWACFDQAPNLLVSRSPDGLSGGKHQTIGNSNLWLPNRLQLPPKTSQDASAAWRTAVCWLAAGTSVSLRTSRTHYGKATHAGSSTPMYRDFLSRSQTQGKYRGQRRRHRLGRYRCRHWQNAQSLLRQKTDPAQRT